MPVYIEISSSYQIPPKCSLSLYMLQLYLNMSQGIFFKKWVLVFEKGLLYFKKSCCHIFLLLFNFQKLIYLKDGVAEEVIER